jgi:hypothetical protein
VIVDAAVEAAEPEAAAPKLDVRLEPVDVKPNDKPATVEIVAPIAEQIVNVPKATGLVFRLAVEGWPTNAKGDGVLCALDAERPRRWVKGMKLGDLTAEGASVSEGEHVLAVSLVRGNGEIVRGPAGSRQPFAMVRFWVGARNAAPEAPRVLLFEPSGTYNGEAKADGLRIDFLAAPERLGVTGGRARVTLTGNGVKSEREVAAWQPLSVKNLPSGDFDIEVTLLDAAGKALAAPARARRTISVNRDVAVPADE